MDYRELELTYILPVYQENNDINDLEKLISIYEEYDEILLKKIHFIFIDDCSPIPVKINSKRINYTLLRIVDDIKWNQGGARNLGVHMSKTSKLILTDLDHTFPESILNDLVIKKIPNYIYNFRRIKNGKKVNSHPNTFFCSKSVFFKSLGVDEEFCGNYGYEDIYFKELQKYLGTRFKKYRKESIVLFDHEQHSLVRDSTKNEKLLNEKMDAINNKKPFSSHSRKNLCFNWEEKTSNWITS